jgi:hypothetical protein
LPTIGITQVAEITALVKPSRAVFVAHPFGLTFGDIGDRRTQRTVVEKVLEIADSIPFPGIIDSGIRWDKDDLRAGQLRKRRRKRG